MLRLNQGQHQEDAEDWGVIARLPCPQPQNHYIMLLVSFTSASASAIVIHCHNNSLCNSDGLIFPTSALASASATSSKALEDQFKIYNIQIETAKFNSFLQSKSLSAIFGGGGSGRGSRSSMRF